MSIYYHIEGLKDLSKINEGIKHFLYVSEEKLIPVNGQYLLITQNSNIITDKPVSISVKGYKTESYRLLSTIYVGLYFSRLKRVRKSEKTNIESIIEEDGDLKGLILFN